MVNSPKIILSTFTSIDQPNYFMQKVLILNLSLIIFLSCKRDDNTSVENMMVLSKVDTAFCFSSENQQRFEDTSKLYVRKHNFPCVNDVYGGMSIDSIKVNGKMVDLGKEVEYSFYSSNPSNPTPYLVKNRFFERPLIIEQYDLVEMVFSIRRCTDTITAIVMGNLEATDATFSKTIKYPDGALQEPTKRGIKSGTQFNLMFLKNFTSINRFFNYQTFTSAAKSSDTYSIQYFFFNDNNSDFGAGYTTHIRLITKGSSRGICKLYPSNK